MIHVDKLMAAIKDRVQIWEFFDIFTDEQYAKKVAAKLFINDTGVLVKKTKEGSYIVLSWLPKRSYSNE